MNTASLFFSLQEYVSMKSIHHSAVHLLKECDDMEFEKKMIFLLPLILNLVSLFGRFKLLLITFGTIFSGFN